MDTLSYHDIKQVSPVLGDSRDLILPAWTQRHNYSLSLFILQVKAVQKSSVCSLQTSVSK